MTQNTTPVRPIQNNAIITQLNIQQTSTPRSIAPEFIRTDSLIMRPVFEYDFIDVKALFQNVSSNTLKHYSERKRTLPDSIREFLLEKQAQWEAATRFEYGIEYNNELVGKTYFAPHNNMTACVFGIWLHKDYWGNEIAQERADAFIHIAFEHLDLAFVTVGAIAENTNSIRSIEKYVTRYGGSYYGNVPNTTNRFYLTNDPHDISNHHEWVITKTDFESGRSGISTTIPNVEYEDIQPVQNTDA